MNEANNVLTIKTVQIQPIRNMITAIKDILTDATITYTDNGLKIIFCNTQTDGVFFRGNIAKRNLFPKDFVSFFTEANNLLSGF